MCLRSPRERALQTLAFELGGLALATPLYAAAFGQTPGESLFLIAAVALACVAWTPLHDTAFDLVEWRLAGRVASDRPHGLRIAHALSIETTATAVSLPVIMWLGGHGLWEALAIELGLTALYVAYGYAFHLAYDRLRPVVPAAGGRRSG